VIYKVFRISYSVGCVAPAVCLKRCSSPCRPFIRPRPRPRWWPNPTKRQARIIPRLFREHLEAECNPSTRHIPTRPSKSSTSPSPSLNRHYYLLSILQCSDAIRTVNRCRLIRGGGADLLPAKWRATPVHHHRHHHRSRSRRSLSLF
jgi:hypothetical protein